MMKTSRYIWMLILTACAAASCEMWPDRQVFEGSGLGAVSKYYELPETKTDTLVDVIATMQYDIRFNADWLTAPATSQGREGFRITCEANTGVTRMATIILAIDQTNHYDTLTVCQSGTTAMTMLKGTEEGSAKIALNSEVEDAQLSITYFGTDSDWIVSPEIISDEISFTYMKNDGVLPRMASIKVSYKDSEGRALTHGFDVFQYNSEDDHVPAAESVVDLTSDGRWANSYILAEADATIYSVDAKSVSGNLISPAIRTADVLWETVEGTVGNVFYDPIDKKFYFEKKGGAAGNAVIALRDNTGRILWSYHVWAPGQTVNDVVIGGVTFMDRNIGAMTKSAPSGNETASVGMHYQWGRKDPFPPAASLGTANGVQSTVYPADAIKYIAANEGHSGKPLSYTIENPTTYIWGSGATGMEDWSQVQNDGYWNSAVKTDYDPCPYGYVVPSKDQLQAVVGVWDSSTNATKGKNIVCDDGSVNYWVKAGWYRRSYHATSNLANVGNNGYYWTSTPVAYSASVRGSYASEGGNMKASVRRWGGTVRCVKVSL